MGTEEGEKEIVYHGPPVRHIEGFKHVTSVEQKLNPVSEKLGVYVEVSWAEDFLQQ
jgi:hypothetical protein